MYLGMRKGVSMIVISAAEGVSGSVKGIREAVGGVRRSRGLSHRLAAIRRRAGSLAGATSPGSRNRSRKADVLAMTTLRTAVVVLARGPGRSI